MSLLLLLIIKIGNAILLFIYLLIIIIILFNISLTSIPSKVYPTVCWCVSEPQG